MNPVAAVEAVGREPLATLLALAERLSQPPDGHDAQLPMQSQASDKMLPGLAAALAEAAALSPLFAPALDAAQAEALAMAQAQQGRMTLGQMAQQSKVNHAHAESTLVASAASDLSSRAAQLSLAAPQLAAAAGSSLPAGATLLAVPVLMNPLQTPASAHTRGNGAVQPEPARQQGGQQQRGDELADDPHDEPHGEGHDAPAASQSQADTTAGDLADSLLDAKASNSQALRELLRQHGSPEVRRELQAGRRLMVVLPQADAGRGMVAARVALLGPAGMRLFAHTRWWASDRSGAADSATNTAHWPQWRVFREGDPLRAPLLVSRAGGHGCRVLLGAPAPRLLDSHGALLELPERLRFVQALGGQWSLLLVVAPPGVLA